jgi:hypothetical protein
MNRGMSTSALWMPVCLHGGFERQGWCSHQCPNFEFQDALPDGPRMLTDGRKQKMWLENLQIDQKDCQLTSVTRGLSSLHIVWTSVWATMGTTQTNEHVLYRVATVKLFAWLKFRLTYKRTVLTLRPIYKPVCIYHNIASAKSCMV